MARSNAKSTAPKDGKNPDDYKRTQRRAKASSGHAAKAAPRTVADVGLRADFSQEAFERHAALLGDPRLAQPVHAQQRAEILRQFQRDYGNHYVQRLVAHISRTKTEGVQTKLTVGPADDQYEREADKVAQQVVERQPEEEELQTRSLVQRQPEEEELQTRSLVQRQPEEEELQTRSLVQRQMSAEGGEVGPEVEQAIHQAKGSGWALPENVRASMEGAFGADFSGVRVHADAKSDTLNSTLSARAFTTGRDIFIRRSDYNPGSQAGQELIAHELTHVVQQGGAEAQRQGAEEEELTQMKRNVQRHSLEEAAEEESGVVQMKPESPTGVLQRDKKDDKIKASFKDAFDSGDKDEAVNKLKKGYKLDTKEYDLSVAVLPKATTHASTSGGWEADNKTFRDITVKVNEPYLDKQATTDAGYTKLLHTLGHEYQHVKQRHKKGWRGVGGAAGSGEREFLAYSWEVLDAKKKKSLPEMDKDNTLATIKKAKSLGWDKMTAQQQKKYQSRYDELIEIEEQLKGPNWQANPLFTPATKTYENPLYQAQ